MRMNCSSTLTPKPSVGVTHTIWRFHSVQFHLFHNLSVFLSVTSSLLTLSSIFFILLYILFYSLSPSLIISHLHSPSSLLFPPIALPLFLSLLISHSLYFIISFSLSSIFSFLLLIFPAISSSCFFVRPLYSFCPVLF